MERSPFSTRKNWEKSTPPNASPIGGMMMSLTSELTMPVKEAPMITPTARSTTLPRMANFLNSANRDMGLASFEIALKANRAGSRQQAAVGSPDTALPGPGQPAPLGHWPGNRPIRRRGPPASG